MLRFASIAVFVTLTATSVAAETAIPDLRGTWKGDSESVIFGGGNPHHSAGKPGEPDFRTLPFTLEVENQDGRRFYGTFSSPRSSEKIIGVVSRNGTLYVADDEGYTHGTVLAADRIELCYLFVTKEARVASCTEMAKQK